MFYQLQSSAILEFHPPSDVSISIGQVFPSDQLCPVSLIIQVLKEGNVSITSEFWIVHSMMTHTNQDEDEGADFERKQAIWMLKEK